MLLALQAIKMWTWFSHVDFTSGLPIMNVDYAQYYGRALRTHAFLSASGRIWGYDPFDMAGYVSGPFLEVGTHLLSLIAHLLSPIFSIGTTLLALEILGLSLAPLLVIPAVRNVGGTRAQAWSAFAITIIVFGFLDPFSEAMYRVGLYGFMVAGFVGILQVSLAWRWLISGAWKIGVLLCVVTAALFQIHPASLVVVLVPNIVLLLALAPRLGFRRFGGTLAFIGIALAANAYWIRPFAAFSDWKTDAPYFVTSGFHDVWWMFNPLQHDLFRGLRLTMLLYITGLATIAVAGFWRRHRPLGAAITLWLATLFLAGFFGSQIPLLQTLQPGRNSFAFWIVAGVVAGMAAPGAILAYRDRRRFAVMIYAVCVVMMFAPLPRLGLRSVPLTNRLPVGQLRFIEAIRDRQVNGRILVECADTVAPHFADLLPFMAPGHVFLGGQHPGNFTKGRFSLFSGAYPRNTGWVNDDPTAFNRSLKSMGPQELEEYLRLYNVALVAARTDTMRQALAPFSSLLGPPEPAGDYVIYPVLKSFDWFEEGSGKVAFALDRITIDDAATGRLVLRSHWIKTLRADPPVAIQPVYLADDPVPFISIDNAIGHRRLVVYNAGLWQK